MGAARQLASIMGYKKVKKTEIAEMIGKDVQYLYNAFYKDNLTYDRVEEIADILGCDIIFKDRETGKEY